MNIELIKIDDKPIKRRVFMKDHAGKERRRKPKLKQFTRIIEIAIVICGVASFIMLTHPS